MSSNRHTSALLDLPLEIRCLIWDELFFRQKSYGSCIYPIGRQPTLRHVRLSTTGRTTYFDTSIIRTCKQLQQEAECLLYSQSLWTIEGKLYKYCGPSDESRENIAAVESLSPRLRGMIRRFEIILEFHISGLISMTSLAQNCPYLPCLPSWTFYAAEQCSLSRQRWKHPLKAYEEVRTWVHGILQTKKPLSSLVELDEMLTYLQAQFAKAKMPIEGFNSGYLSGQSILGSDEQPGQHSQDYLGASE